MARKIRVNWTIDPTVYDLLKKMSKFSHTNSISKIVETLVLEKFANKKKMIEDEKRKLAIRINELNEELYKIENQEKKQMESEIYG